MKVTLTDKELVGEYVSTLLQWVYDDSRRGKKTIREKIAKLGNELVERDLLSREDADNFYKGEQW